MSGSFDVHDPPPIHITPKHRACTIDMCTRKSKGPCFPAVLAAGTAGLAIGAVGFYIGRKWSKTVPESTNPRRLFKLATAEEAEEFARTGK